jgi:hypothetical protein
MESAEKQPKLNVEVEKKAARFTQVQQLPGRFQLR